MKKTAEFAKMVKHLDAEGFDVSSVLSETSRLTHSAAPEVLSEFTDEELVCYHSALVACIDHPPRFASRDKMVDEAWAVADELAKRKVHR